MNTIYKNTRNQDNDWLTSALLNLREMISENEKYTIANLTVDANEVKRS